MKDSTSTALLNAPISQEVLHPEEYDLAAEISQFSEFQDNWGEDLVNEFKIQLDNQDDDSLLENDSNSKDDSEDDDKDDDKDNSKDDSKDNNEDDSEDNNKTSIFF